MRFQIQIDEAATGQCLQHAAQAPHGLLQLQRLPTSQEVHVQLWLPATEPLVVPQQLEERGHEALLQGQAVLGGGGEGGEEPAPARLKGGHEEARGLEHLDCTGRNS